MGNPEKQDNDLEKQDRKNEKETRDSLADFGNNPDNDKKLLEDPKGGEKSVNAIKGDIEEKTKSINDPKAKAQINEKLKGLDKYIKIGKLNEAQAQELSNIYKQISAIEGTEHAEDVKSGEEAQKSSEAQNEANTKKLLDAVERLDKLSNSHDEQKQQKIINDNANSRLARNEQQEPPSSYENLEFPPSQKESPQATA